MFEFLKDILGVPRPVEVVDFEDPLVTLKCANPIDIGMVNVSAEIEGVRIRAQVQVLHEEKNTYKAIWLQPREVLPLLREVFGNHEKRTNDRVQIVLEVRSPDLSGFVGQTLDISTTGLRLEGQGDFALGSTMSLCLELADELSTKINTQAEICWIAPSQREGWKALGLRYKDLNEELQVADFLVYRDFIRVRRKQIDAAGGIQ